MAENRTSWIFELLDKASAPANRIAKALGVVGDAGKKAGHGAHEAESGFERLVHTFHDLAHIGEMAGEALHFVGEKVFELGKEAIAEAGFKQNAIIGLEALAGTRAVANDLFEKTEAFAFATGGDIKRLMGITKDLASSGFDAESIEVMHNAIGDLLAVRGQGDADTLAYVLADVGRKGILAERALMALNHAGISSKDIIDNLAKATGRSAAEVQKLLSAGRIGKNLGISAILDAEAKRYSGGVLGSVAKKAAQTITGAEDRVKLIPQVLLNALAGGAEAIGDDKFGSLARVFTNIADAFDPRGPSGQRILVGLRSLVDAIANMLGLGGGDGGFLADLAGPNGPKRVEEIFLKITDSIRAALPIIHQFVQDVATAAGWLSRIFHVAVNFTDLLGGKTGLDLTAARKLELATNTLNDPNASPDARDYAQKVLAWAPAATVGAGGGQANYNMQLHFHGQQDPQEVKDAVKGAVHEAHQATSHFERLSLQAGAQ